MIQFIVRHSLIRRTHKTTLKSSHLELTMKRLNALCDAYSHKALSTLELRVRALAPAHDDHFVGSNIPSAFACQCDAVHLVHISCAGARACVTAAVTITHTSTRDLISENLLFDICRLRSLFAAVIQFFYAVIWHEVQFFVCFRALCVPRTAYGILIVNRNLNRISAVLIAIRNGNNNKPFRF